MNEQKKCFNIITTLVILELFKTNQSCGIKYILHAENVAQRKYRVICARSISALNIAQGLTNKGKGCAHLISRKKIFQEKLK